MLMKFTKSALASFAILAASQFAHADTLIKIERHLPAVKSGGFSTSETTDTTMIWIGDGKARMDADRNSSTLYDAKTDKAVNLNRKFKIYFAPGLNPFSPAPAKEDSAVGLSAGLEALSPKMITTVHETDSLAKIGGYICRLWIQRDSMTILPMVSVSEVWATEDVKLDLQLYRKVQQAMMSNPIYDSIYEETNKVRGLAIRTDSGPEGDVPDEMINLGKSRILVISIETVNVPPDHYDVPKEFESYPPEPEEE